jgi:hypothetical protein
MNTPKKGKLETYSLQIKGITLAALDREYSDFHAHRRLSFAAFLRNTLLEGLERYKEKRNDDS